MRTAAALLTAASAAAATFDVQLLVTREVRGAAYSVDAVTGNECDTAGFGTCACDGGADRRQSVLAASSAANVVSIDTGSYFAGSGRFFPAFGGNASAELFADAGYEAFGLSYRDFTAGGGPATLARYLQLASSHNPSLPKPVATNLDLATDPLLSSLVDTYTIVDLADARKLAVLSLTDPTHLAPHASTASYAARAGAYWRSLHVALAELRRLATPPAVVVVLVSDIPLTDAEVDAAGSREAAATAALSRLVEESLGVDVFLLGDFDVLPATPHVASNWMGDDVLIVPSRAMTLGRHVDNVTLRFSDAGLLDGNSSAAVAISLDCAAPAAGATSTRLSELRTQSDALLAEVVGSSQEAMDDSATATVATSCAAPSRLGPGRDEVCGCRVAECKQGAFAADALQSVTGADVAIVNGGALSGSLPAGSVSAGSLLELLPFHSDEVLTLRVSGATLRAALANGVSRLGLAGSVSSPDGRFLQTSSSLQYTWHLTAAHEAGLSTVHVTLGSALVGGVPAGGSSSLLNDTHTYTLAVTEYLANGGDGYTMLSDAPVVARYGFGAHHAAQAYLSAQSAGGPLPLPESGPRISQRPDLRMVEIGILCETDPVGASSEVLTGAREDCDHLHHVIDLINDKHDGFMDDLLPNAFIKTAEAKIGCVNNLGQSAMDSLRAALPDMIAVVGVPCSNDVKWLGGDYRGSGWRGIVASGGSTAPSIADEAAYPNVLRAVTTEVGLGKGLSLIAAGYSWNRVAVLHDDSAWATEAAAKFVEQHAADTAIDAEVLNEGDSVTQGFSVSDFDAGRLDVRAILERAASFGTRIVYLATQLRIARAILGTSYSEKILHGNGYGWLLGWVGEDIMRNADGSVNTDAVYGAEGCLGVNEDVGSDTAVHQQYKQLWLSHSSAAGCQPASPAQGNANLQPRVYCDGDGDPAGSLPVFAATFADAALTVIRAMHGMDEHSWSDPDEVYAAVKALEPFDGVSGRVMYDGSADRLGNLNVLNLQITTSRRLAALIADDAPAAAAGEEEESLATVPPRFREGHRHLYVPLSTSSADWVKLATWSTSSSTLPDLTGIIFPGRVTTPPTDRILEDPIVGIVGGAVGAVVLLACGLMLWQRHHAKKKIGALKAELEKFKDSVVGMRAVVEDFDPRSTEGFTYGVPSPRATGESGPSEWPAEEVPAETMEEVAVEEAAAPRVASARWWWQEDDHNIDKHARHDVKQPGNWVSYAGSVCRELDAHYAAFLVGGPRAVLVDLTDRIGSTGTEAKAHNQHTGVQFQIDFGQMAQVNAVSGFKRAIMREENQEQAGPRVLSSTKSKHWGAAASKAGAANKMRKGAAKRSMNLSPGVSKTFPDELAGEDALILHAGQILQTSKQRSDGWAFGNVVYDEMEDRPPIGVDGMSTQAGWFPLWATEHPTPAQLKALQEQMGGSGASAALQPPPTWSAVKDPLTPDLITLPDGPEKNKVVSAFMATLDGRVRVVSVERIQSMSMWQSYAVKRQTILMREKDSNTTSSRFEKVWLFHGTDQDTVPKIIQQGFNRSFCGKNATVYGKGVYFARDASYSSSTTYSRPNAKGVQHMFLCRVTVGEYCLGKQNALTPDVRSGHQLYDATVNDMRSPGIYVTYHDAQAYPEYLVKFKQ